MADSCGEKGIKVLREIADSCRRQQWSIAIRLLSSLPNLSSSPVLLCNRALCYSKLELYKHVIKDCNDALVLNSCTLQAYLYKGEAMVAMGKREKGSLVWQHGYEAGLDQPSDLQMMLQLQSLAAQSNSPTSPKNWRSSISMQVEEWVTPASKKISSVDIEGLTQKEGSDWDKRQSNQALPILSIDLSLRRGIAQVNSGSYGEAVQTFTELIRENPRSTGAFIARGTAYAFQRKLEVAIDDFTKAIELDPTVVEAWKRRGQARTATGSNLEAIADLSKALELEPKSADALYERGVVYFKIKDYQSAIEDLRTSLALDGRNRYAYNYYGLALTSTGEYVEAMNAHSKALQLDPSLKEAWTHLAKLHKELGNSEKALICLQQVLTMDDKCLGVWRVVAVGLRSHLEVGYTFQSRYVHAYRLKGLLLFSLGDHRGAVKELTTGLEMESGNLDVLYLRGSCYHAVGSYAEAVKDYDEVLNAGVISRERCTLQSLAFYQRQTALYAASKWDEPFNNCDIDGDLDPKFKEAWCKRLSPLVLFPKSSRQLIPRDLLNSGHLAQADLTVTKSGKTLLESADRLGQLIQYNCPGFLKNVRQHRMAGLAVLEIAQKAATILQGSIVLKPEELTSDETGANRQDISMEDVIQNKDPSSSDKGPDKHRARLTWRDIYSVAVKWRQASEPCDPVVWVDMLSEKEYTAGFGSHTPLLLGQVKVVRYYPNFHRALVVVKNLILAQRQVYSAANRPLDLSDPMQLLAIDAAANCRELYNVIGEDFWLVAPCHSTSTQGKVLDGTRFTLQKTGLNAYDFSIRTPCTPPRWADYDEELTAAWEEYCNLFCERKRSADNSQVLKKLQDCILRLSYYWYNFMPLARGTAVVGYVMLLGLFLAADMEITASIPQGMQVDWEAILSQDLNMFMEAVWPWMYPSVKMDTSWQPTSETELQIRRDILSPSGRGCDMSFHMQQLRQEEHHPYPGYRRTIMSLSEDAIVSMWQELI